MMNEIGVTTTTGVAEIPVVYEREDETHCDLLAVLDWS
jgi:hypothetical protein